MPATRCGRSAGYWRLRSSATCGPCGSAAAGLPALTGLATATRQAGAITGDEADNWISEQTRRAQEDRLLAAIPMFLATGSR